MARSKWLEGKIRALRNNARREAIRNDEATVGDGTEVHHGGAGFSNVKTLKEAQQAAASSPKKVVPHEQNERDGQKKMVDQRVASGAIKRRTTT